MVHYSSSRREKAVMSASHQYSLSELMKDLLQFAAEYLTLNGRLVFWLPVYRHQSVKSLFLALG